MAFALFSTILVMTCLVAVTRSAPQAQADVVNYKTIGPCNEVCPRFPDLVCKLDCLYVNADGTSGTDCINHFYDRDGNIFHDCWL